MNEPPSPRANPALVGQDAPARALRDAALGGRPHHAWLLSGPMGVGKATLAWRFSRWLLADRPEAPPGEVPLFVPPGHPVFSRVAAGSHADVRLLAAAVAEGKKKVQIGVEEARALPRFLAMTPAEGGWRVVILDDADRLHPAAANAILKTLEEPPPRTVLMLLSDAPARLLPTVRSRCRSLALRPLAEESVRGIVAGWWPSMPAEEAAQLAAISRGSPGRALLMAAGDGLALAREVEAVLRALPRPDAREMHAVAERIASKRDGSALLGFVELLRDAIAAGLREAARGGPAPPWLAAHPPEAWAATWGELGRVVDRTELLNLDRKQTVLGALRGLGNDPRL